MTESEKKIFMYYLLSPPSRTPETHLLFCNLIPDLVFIGPLRSVGITSLGPDFMWFLSSQWITTVIGDVGTATGGVALSSLARIILGNPGVIWNCYRFQGCIRDDWAECQCPEHWLCR